MPLKWTKPTQWGVQVSPEAAHYAETWGATPTPVYNEFRVDWKKLTADDPAEVKRISDMWKGQLDKLKEKYPGFNVNAVAKWPSGNSMVSPHAFWGPTLMEFARLERAAGSGYESPGHMMESAKREMAGHEDMKKARDTAEAKRYSKVKTADLLGLNEKKEKDLLTFPSREKELEGLFKGGRGKKSRTSKKSKKSRKTRRRA
jgi:hypothetical protein